MKKYFRSEHCKVYFRAHPYGHGKEKEFDAVGSFSFGASRSEGQGWLRPYLGVVLSSNVSSPSAGITGDGREIVTLPENWDFLVITARDLKSEVRLEGDEEVRVQKARNALGILGSVNSKVHLDLSWWKKAGRHSRSFEWHGNASFVGGEEGIRFDPDPPQFKEI